MSVKINGFDKLQKELKQLQKSAEKLSKKKEINFGELFDTTFMKRYTNASSIEEFFQTGGFSAYTTKEFEAIPDDELDKYVSENTNFSSWENMLDTATEEYITKSLGL